MKNLCILSVLLIASCLPSFSQPKKSAGITASLPWGNNYQFYNYDSKASQNKSGFVGWGWAVFYQWNKNRLVFNNGNTYDLPAPFGVVDFVQTGTRVEIASRFHELYYGRKVHKNIQLLAGLNYVKYDFEFISHVSSQPPYNITDRTVGLTLGAEYDYKFIGLAAFYRPALISFDQKSYRHLITLDARFNITVWKKK